MSESNGYVTREQMIAPDERDYKDVQVPLLGKVQIQTITEQERARMEAPNYRKDGSINLDKMGDARCRLVVIGTIKPQLSMGDVQYLRGKDQRIIDVLSAAIAEHCGISAKDMEELEKNSPTPVGASQGS